MKSQQDVFFSLMGSVSVVSVSCRLILGISWSCNQCNSYNVKSGFLSTTKGVAWGGNILVAENMTTPIPHCNTVNSMVTINH